ncbi:hypothetical protein CEP51_004363 [Fusarium floridanum]|uniref:Uncharacterized protein n=1 Tax=Fusarium floridanum TaxID=1325733 RepID=A0A428S1T9_9HYPO|nr:hypothetical protein CEP51_004363 [Fusarium floridanum]
MSSSVSGNTLPSTGYSIPWEARKIFFEGIISNPLITPTLPPEAVDLAQSITFKGSPQPSLPINWRFAESISSLKAYEALLLSILLKRKYGLGQVPIEIDTDHAQLFLMSSLIWTLDPDGENLNAGSIMNPEGQKKLAKYFPSWDKHNGHSTLHRVSATNIYTTKDGKYFHLHGSMNPDPTLDSIGLPYDMQADSLEEAREPFVEAVGKLTSEEMQHLATDVYRQAGTICYTVNEYRQSVFDKYGFSEQDIIDMCRERERGIIYARENCYGWQGPWKDRSGWQQISDANCGVSYEFGRAMGNDEPVTPVFPNSDYCTGVAGICGILSALIRRGESGGSYTVDWLVNSVGTYPDQVWQDLWKRNGSSVFRYFDPMQTLVPKTLQIVMKNSGQTLFKPEFFHQYSCRYLGKDVKIVAPILRFPNGDVKPGFNVGTRSNGVDATRWPEDPSVEVVT